MGISSAPPLDKMAPEDAARMVVEEDPQPESAVAASASDIIPHKEFRYHTCQIVGLEKAVRFRSLTLGEFNRITATGNVQELDLVKSAIVDGNGHNYATDAALVSMQEADPRTWAHVLTVAIKHCLGGTLDDLTEEAQKPLLEQLIEEAEKN